MPVSREDASRVKDKVMAHVRTHAAVAGVGLTKAGADYAIKVNLSRPPMKQLPSEFDGVQIVYEVIGQIRPQSAD